MKTLFLLFCFALLIAIDSKKDEGYSLVKFDETNGKHIKWVWDNAGEEYGYKLITTIKYLLIALFEFQIQKFQQIPQLVPK